MNEIQQVTPARQGIIYTNDFWAGVTATLALIRSGSTADDIEAIVPGGTPDDLDAYHTSLRELAQITSSDYPQLYGGDDHAK